MKAKRSSRTRPARLGVSYRVLIALSVSAETSLQRTSPVGVQARRANWVSTLVAGWALALSLCLTPIAGQGADDATWEAADAVYQEASDAQTSGNFEEAIALYRDALAAVQALGSSYQLHESIIWHNMGSCYRSLSRYAEAIAHYERALVIRRELGEKAREANTLKNLALSHRSLSNFQQAILLSEQALAIATQLGDRDAVGEILNVLGGCLVALSDYEQAIDIFEQVLAIEREERDLRGEAKALNNIAACFLNLADYQEAIDRFQEALGVFRRLHDRGQEAYALNNLGACHLRLADYGSARVLFEEALDLFRRRRLKPGEATALMNLGQCFQELGDYETAIAFHEEALLIDREIGARLHEASVLGSLGECSEASGDNRRAIEFHLEALEVYRSIEARHGEALELVSVAECLARLLDFPLAIERYEEALSLAEALGVRDTERDARWGLGRAHREQGNLSAALMQYREAIEITEDIRRTVEQDELRRAYFESLRRLYEEYLELLTDLGRGSETLEVAERCRARTFLDLVAAGPIGELETVAEEGMRTGVVDAAVIGADLTEVAARLPSDTAALEYFVTEESIYIWVVRDGAASEPVQIEIDLLDLRDRVLLYRTAIETPASDLSELTDEATLKTSRDLYELLIAPVEDQLDGIDHLVVVPSGPLYYLPFATLFDCADCEGLNFLGGEYLIERFSLSCTPSLTTLKYAWASAVEVQADSLFLAVADPDGGDPMLPRLPDAQKEAATVAGLFTASEIYVDTEATEEIAGSRGSSADQLLLSTHGVFNPVNPMFSYLLLSPTDETDGRLYTHEIFSLDLRTDLVTLSACETLLPALQEMEDDVRAVRGMPVDEDVELSEELLEKLTAGDEIVGLTRAFLYAGTPSVLSTLWRVVSETTEPLMVAFYTYLQQGLDKAEALRQAQLDVMAMYPHPRYWAAFCLVGDWR